MIRSFIKYSWVALVLTFSSGSAIGKTLELPISFDSRFLTRLLEESVFRNQEGLSVWGDEDGCNDLTLSNPRVMLQGDSITILTDANAKTGWFIGGRCVGLLRWQGGISALQRADIMDPKGRIAFSTVDTELLDRNGQRAKISARLWDLAKDNVHPHFDQLSIDLTQAMDEISQMLPLFFAEENLERSQKLVDSFHLEKLRSEPGKLVALVNFDIDTFTVVERPPHDRALSQLEIQQFVETWERWDAFLSFVVKIAAHKIIDPEKREVLLETLIETRYALVEILGNPEAPNSDPVRQSFIKAWKQLAPVFREISLDIKGRESLRFLGFIAAADALHAVDALGPVTGWDITVDGLRRLARLLIYEPGIDPLEVNPEVDLEMRELFNFGPAIEIPAEPLEPENQGDDEAIDKPAEPTNTIDIEPVEDSSENVPDATALFLRTWLLSAASANTTEAILIKDINRVVPNRANISAYLPLVRELLLGTVDQTLEAKSLETAYQPLYRDLVLTTAWQETCWRQYQGNNGKFKPITSSAGALGIMQIMPRVWRGFYDTKSLGNSIAYNATAGSEILHRYLVRYAIRKGEHKQEGGTDNLVRASYAAYNGGPSQLRRYRKSSTRKSLQKIDNSFWEKFLQVRAGNELAVSKCYPYG